MHSESPSDIKKISPSPVFIKFLLAVGLLIIPGLLLYTACTFQVGFESTPLPNDGLTATIIAISTDNALLTELLATIQLEGTGTPGPSFVSQSHLPASPTPSPPVFRNLFFSKSPDGEPAQSFFPAGTERIYAFWDYANMGDGMVVRRVWYQEGRPLFVREEEWNTIQHGGEGRMSGVSIYNEEIGFPTGRYSLTLFINGVEQAEIDLAQRTFWLIEPKVESPTDSPDGTQSAFIQAAGSLFIKDINGEIRLLSIFEELSHLSWFPNSRHILVGERDRTFQTSISDDTGISHKLWVVEVFTGERHLIGAAGENLHSPSLSPRGDLIALLSGPTIQETCRASPTLVIIKLDDEFHRQSVFQIHDFSGFAIEDPPSYGIYPRISRDTFLWTDQYLLEVELWWSCPEPGQALNDGVYQFNLNEMAVERK
jgi:hypothetical protein